MHTLGIFACTVALLGGCYDSYAAVPDGDWDVFHPVEDARGDVRDRDADADAEAEADADAGAADSRVDADAGRDDGALEYVVTLLITVDDWYVRLCVNDVDVLTDPVASQDWYQAETYAAVMKSGLNVIGVHGADRDGTISAFVMRAEVNGTTYLTSGVRPGEPDTTPWRHWPDVAPESNWCSPGYDDSAWGPAHFVAEWGSDPWSVNPPEFSGVGADWIWDERPYELHENWFRLEVVLP